MAEKKLILVSASKRRKELLELMGMDFTVDAKTKFRETIPEGMAPEKVPEYFAEQKSLHFHRELTNSDVLISADTVVICDGKLMGKPHHRSDAKKMLEALSGKTHKVITALCVRTSSKCTVVSDTAMVTFNDLDKDDIDYYVEKYLPMDKAGAYGIQEWIGMIGISRIEGSFYTIMGLPTHLLYSILKKL